MHDGEEMEVHVANPVNRPVDYFYTASVKVTRLPVLWYVALLGAFCGEILPNVQHLPIGAKNTDVKILATYSFESSLTLTRSLLLKQVYESISLASMTHITVYLHVTGNVNPGPLKSVFSSQQVRISPVTHPGLWTCPPNDPGPWE